ncbi:winged helix-turn-helix transcriptional regulator [Haloarcula sp. JP-Z28]|jgi:predicted transcriptional regulator|uniref:Transcriptional regulator n=1 Tax=Haloarcula marismortui ATCC 33800 TaxID=662476 RepID=M0JNN2_9EURY|nr:MULTISPECIES: winged helix-turn-helix transcriptional regulator [Haloarcula]EMA09300.1 transcriptional regulator [Haloarcula sinaiiensis ATCC 33800]NHN64186.1 winged helix-turn-helix transcriptional regulator [Haloarcula sp. JP-Z28]QUJ74266.1 winged helix-turn-helix transcriptional regulator [Haloarcula sinaiiensis ATCC 33800]
MTTTRTRIELQIRRNPGTHFNELVRSLEFAPGQIQYHTRKLSDEAEVIEESLYGRTHYFPPEFDSWERGALALFRRETSREILGYLLENEAVKPQAVADSLGIARSTLEWHLSHLIEQDVILKERDEQNRITLVVAHPERTHELLREISPSIPDRFVDRFTRLVDSLLSEQHR